MWYTIISIIPFLIWSVILRGILATRRPFNYRGATAITTGVVALLIVGLCLDRGRLPNTRGFLVFGGILVFTIVFTYWQLRIYSQVYGATDQDDHPKRRP